MRFENKSNFIVAGENLFLTYTRSVCRPNSFVLWMVKVCERYVWVKEPTAKLAPNMVKSFKLLTKEVFHG